MQVYLESNKEMLSLTTRLQVCPTTSGCQDDCAATPATIIDLPGHMSGYHLTFHRPLFPSVARMGS